MTQRAIAFVSIGCAVIVPISLFVLFAVLGQHTLSPPPLQFHELFLVAGIYFLICNIPGLILGLSALLLLRKFACLRWWSLCAVVFASGVICSGSGIYLSLFDSTDATAHFWDSATVVSHYGVPTRDGWLFLIRRSSYIGAVGALTAMCGWIAWKVLQRSNNRLEQRVANPGR
jgi:hypothetical protein